MSTIHLGIILCLVIVAAFFVICLRWLFNEGTITRQLEREGQTLEADIVNTGRETVGKGRRLYVTYRFSPANTGGGSQYISRSQTISERQLHVLAGHSTVTISYLPNNPAISRLSGSNIDHSRHKVVETGMLLAIVIGCAAFYLLAVAQ